MDESRAAIKKQFLAKEWVMNVDKPQINEGLEVEIDVKIVNNLEGSKSTDPDVKASKLMLQMLEAILAGHHGFGDVEIKLHKVVQWSGGKQEKFKVLIPRAHKKKKSSRSSTILQVGQSTTFSAIGENGDWTAKVMVTHVKVVKMKINDPQ